VATCDECGFDWESPSQELVAELASFGSAYETCLTRLLPDEDVSVLREKSSPTVWSALEYTAHMRDVVEFYAERISRVLNEEMAQLTPRDFAALAEERSYNLEDPEVVLSQLAEACTSTSALLSRLTAYQWERAGVGSEGGERTVLLLARRLVHDGHHHLLDVERVLRRARTRH
jgi:hypothetical protein